MTLRKWTGYRQFVSAGPPVVVFSVDGLMACPHSMTSEVESVLRRVTAKRLPLVLFSTKTRAELEFIQQGLGLRHPFVCENGAAVYVPTGYFDIPVPTTRVVPGYEVIEFGRPYAEVVDALHRTARSLGIDIVGFHDMAIEDVAVEWRLPLLQARLAKMREYGEPFRIVSGNLRHRQQLIRALWPAGIACTCMGQYDHAGAPAGEGMEHGDERMEAPGDNRVQLFVVTEMGRRYVELKEARSRPSMPPLRKSLRWNKGREPPSCNVGTRRTGFFTASIPAPEA